MSSSRLRPVVLAHIHQHTVALSSIRGNFPVRQFLLPCPISGNR